MRRGLFILWVLLAGGDLARLPGQEFRVELFSGKAARQADFVASSEPLSLCAIRKPEPCLVLETGATAQCEPAGAGVRCRSGGETLELPRVAVVTSSSFRVVWKTNLVDDHARTAPVRNLELQRTQGRLRAIATMDLETYVAGVLAGEAANLRSPAALGAMAVVARTWALGSRGRHGPEGFDFCSLTHCQVFRPRPGTAEGDPVVADAARETAGEILEYRGRRAEVYFSANCGGMTDAAVNVWPDRAQPYLTVKNDPYCAGAEHSSWQQSLPLDVVRKIVREKMEVSLDGPLREIEIQEKDSSGRARVLRLVGASSRQVDASEFRYAVNRRLGWNTLKSSLFTVERRGDSLVFMGRGLGHGVGLCQAGAERMGQMGLTHEKILAFYFPGTALAKLVESGANLLLSSEHFEIVLPPSQQPWVEETLEALENASRGLAGHASSPPPRVRVQTFESTGQFIRASGQPGWAAASTDGKTILLQPLATLARKGILRATLRHELTHLIVHRRRAPQVPAWFEEGFVLYLTGEEVPPARASKFGGRSLEQTVARPSSEAEMKAAYAQALGEVRELARRRGESALWQMLERPMAADLDWLKSRSETPRRHGP